MATDENTIDENIFDLLKKKKSRKRLNRDVLQETTATTVSTDNVARDESINDVMNENGDFTYDYLLGRIYEKIPIEPTTRVRITLPPPQVARIGTRRTSVMNFGLLCKLLKRPEKLLYEYFTVELGTTASIDSKRALIIRGRLTPTQIQNILCSFIKEYVTCKTCHTPDTLLKKEDRLTVIKCNVCQSQYSVSNIKTGFQAQVTRRSHGT